jgi:hypothetical protein
MARNITSHSGASTTGWCRSLVQQHYNESEETEGVLCELRRKKGSVRLNLTERRLYNPPVVTAPTRGLGHAMGSPVIDFGFGPATSQTSVVAFGRRM